MKSCNLDAQNILTYLAFLAVVVGSHDATLEVAFLFPLWIFKISSTCSSLFSWGSIKNAWLSSLCRLLWVCLSLWKESFYNYQLLPSFSFDVFVWVIPLVMGLPQKLQVIASILFMSFKLFHCQVISKILKSRLYKCIGRDWYRGRGNALWCSLWLSGWSSYWFSLVERLKDRLEKETEQRWAH